MIDPISAMNLALSELQTLASAASAPSPAQLLPDAVGGADQTGAAAPSFSHALRAALGRLDDTIVHANTQAKSFAAGDQTIPLSDVMVSLEQANLAIQMATGVRDKVVAAYSNVMNMQV